MADNEPAKEKETVIVERRGSGGGLLAGLALLILVCGVLAYFGMLPF